MTGLAKRLLVLGFGGHARSVADVAISCGYEDIVFFDEKAMQGETFLGFPAISDIQSLYLSGVAAFPASGSNRERQKQCSLIRMSGLRLTTLVAPTATIGVGSLISEGCFIGHHAHVGAGACIGEGCILNTGSVVEHESVVGEYSHVSVNAVLAGRTALGSFSMLGAGGVVIDRISVVNNVVIGAGAIVVKPILEPGIYVGCPASLLKRVN